MGHGHDTRSTDGLLADYKKRIQRDRLEQLVAHGYIRKSGDFNGLEVTTTGRSVLQGRETPRLLKPAKKSARVSRVAKDSWDGVDKDLFEALRKLRWKIADRKSMPAYIVFGDAALRDMARRRPASPEAFLQVSGVGSPKSHACVGAFLPSLTNCCLAVSVATCQIRVQQA